MWGGPTRSKLSNGLLLAGDIVAVGPAALLVVALSRGLDARWWPVALAGLIVAIISAVSKVLKFYKDRWDKEVAAEAAQAKADQEQLKQKELEDQIKNLKIEAEMAAQQLETAYSKLQESYESGLSDGANEKLALWAEVARNHEDGMLNTYRQLAPCMSFNLDVPASTEAMTSYLRAVMAVFQTFCAESKTAPLDLTATLAVVSSDRAQVHIVKIEPGGRGRSHKIPRPCLVPEMTWGMIDLIQSPARRTNYVRDIRECGVVADRGYISVANLAVWDTQEKLIAIVNVDSPTVDAFGSDEQVEQAYQYALPIISSIALSLEDQRMFRRERS